jgi:dethiobiotin synthetase
MDSRDVIVALRAVPLIVGSNTLGVVNHLRLTLAALPAALRSRAIIVLMSPEKPDASTRSNLRLISEYIAPGNIVGLPWLGQPLKVASAAPRLKGLGKICTLCLGSPTGLPR